MDYKNKKRHAFGHDYAENAAFDAMKSPEDKAKDQLLSLREEDNFDKKLRDKLMEIVLARKSKIKK